MKKIKAFFYVFIKSLTSPSYYKDILTTSRTFTIQYILLLSFIGTMVSVALATSMMAPAAKSEITSFANNSIEVYPDDLEITVTNGELLLNYDSPVIIPVAAIDPEAMNAQHINAIVYDMNGTVEDLKTYDTYVLVNKKNAIVHDPATDEIDSKALDLPEGLHLTKAEVVTFKDKLLSKLDLLIAVFIGIVAVITFVFQLIGIFIMSLLYGLIVFAVAKVKGVDIKYPQAYKLGLHLTTVSLVLGMITDTISYKAPQAASVLSFAAFVAVVIFAYLVVIKLKDDKQSAAQNAN